jgi:hypothetical protein
LNAGGSGNVTGAAPPLALVPALPAEAPVPIALLSSATPPMGPQAAPASTASTAQAEAVNRDQNAVPWKECMLQCEGNSNPPHIQFFSKYWRISRPALRRLGDILCAKDADHVEIRSVLASPFTRSLRRRRSARRSDEKSADKDKDDAKADTKADSKDDAKKADDKPDEKPKRSAQDILTAPDVVFMLSYNDSDVKQAAESKCSASSGTDQKKLKQCMAKARKSLDVDGYRFEQKGGQWSFLTLHTQGKTIKTLHKFEVDFGPEKDGSITLKPKGKDTGSASGRLPGSITIQVPNEYQIVLTDPKLGKLVYEAKIGVASK